MNISMTKHLNNLNCREETHALVDRLFSQLDQENYKSYFGTITISWETSIAIPHTSQKETDTTL